VRQRALVWTGILVLLLAGCGPGQPATVTPTSRAPAGAPTSTPAPGATPIQPTATRPAASPTPSPVAAVPASGPKAGGTLKTYMRNDVPSWDPHLTVGGSDPTSQAQDAVFSLLATVQGTPETDCKTTLASEAAESWRWTDDTTLEVKLRPGILFQNKPPVNGREATAEDVAYSLRRFFKYQVTAALGAIAPHVKSIDAADRYTVRIKTDTYLSSFITVVFPSWYGSVILAKESGGPAEQWHDPKTSYIGTGPFMFVEHVPGVKAVFDKNPTYWKKGLPYLDRVEFAVLPDMSTRVAALLSGKLDLIHSSLPVTQASLVKERRPDMRIEKCPSDNAYRLNFRTDRAPFSDVRVRQALSMAIDRDAIVKSVLQSEGYTLGVTIPGLAYILSIKDYPPEARRYLEYHPDEAKKLLTEAGFPNGFNTTVEFTPGYGSPANEMVEAIVDMFNQVGVKAKLVWTDLPRFRVTVIQGEYDQLSFTKAGVGDSWNDTTRFSSDAGKVSNRSYYKDAETDRLIAAIQSAKGDEALTRAFRDFQIRYATQVPAVLTPSPYDYGAARPQVHGFFLSTAGYTRLTGTWLERMWLDR